MSEKLLLNINEYFLLMKNILLLERGHIKNFSDILEISQIIEHPAYQNIIKAGPPIISLLLKDLFKNKYYPWIFALTEISNHNPVLKEHEKNIKEMANDWIRWGLENNYI